jgi:hypothetical protein
VWDVELLETQNFDASGSQASARSRTHRPDAYDNDVKSFSHLCPSESRSFRAAYHLAAEEGI